MLEELERDLESRLGDDSLAGLVQQYEDEKPHEDSLI